MAVEMVLSPPDFESKEDAHPVINETDRNPTITQCNTLMEQNGIIAENPVKAPPMLFNPCSVSTTVPTKQPS